MCQSGTWRQRIEPWKWPSLIFLVGSILATKCFYHLLVENESYFPQGGKRPPCFLFLIKYLKFCLLREKQEIRSFCLLGWNLLNQTQFLQQPLNLHMRSNSHLENNLASMLIRWIGLPQSLFLCSVLVSFYHQGHATLIKWGIVVFLNRSLKRVWIRQVLFLP